MRRFAGRRAVYLRVIAIWLITAATLVLLSALLSGVEVASFGAALAAGDHPGIGFLLTRSEQYGAIVIGEQGLSFLDEDRVEGEDPLAPFGPNATRHVKRTDGFPSCADIMVNSTYWPERRLPSRNSSARTEVWADRSRTRSCSCRGTGRSRRSP